MNTQQITHSTMDFFDRSAVGLSQQEYKEALEELISNLESRLDCVNEEMDNAATE